MKTSAFQKVSGINPAFLFPSICSTSLLSHPNIIAFSYNKYPGAWDIADH